jgi:hypothetical protein
MAGSVEERAMDVGEREEFAVDIHSQRSDVIVSQVNGCSADEGGVVTGGWKTGGSFDEAAN